MPARAGQQSMCWWLPIIMLCSVHAVDRSYPCQVVHLQVLLPLLTWEVEQHKPHCIWMQLLHLAAEQKAATSQGAHKRVEQVEHLLGGPAVLRHTQLDANQLHLHRQRWRSVPTLHPCMSTSICMC